MSLIFATGNSHKLEEARKILGVEIESVSPDILKNTPPETGETFHQNALIKAKFIFETTGIPCFAEDSGICVEALGGKPGIHSARYSGRHGADSENNELLLKNLGNEQNRKAYFCAVICYVDSEGEHFFEGRVYGRIAEKLSGEVGFGYDPLFIPDGFDKSFAVLGSEIKNSISHRKKALESFSEFLNKK